MSGKVEDDRDDEYVEPQNEPTVRMLRQMLVQNHNSAISGHRRVRNDQIALEQRVNSLEALTGIHESHLQQIDTILTRPVEASSLRFTPGTVFAIVAVCASVIGGEYISSSVVRSDVRDLSTKMDAVQKRNEDYVKLQDERAANWSRLISELKTQQESLDIRFSNWVNGELTRRKQR